MKGCGSTMKNIRKQQLNRGGFTLIEVVLVLAIGGLIFLLAFIAFQQVSANRRDTQRRNDAGRVLAELQNASGDGFTVDTAAKLSTGASSFLATYFGGTLKGPQANYTFNYVTAPATTVAAAGAVDNLYVSYGSSCTAGSNNTFTKKPGSYAVVMGLEKGSVCRDDQ